MGFSQIDLSQLPAPAIIEALSFDTILAAMLADLQSRDPIFTALVESDPAFKILEVCAYRELLIRQRVNNACNGVMLAYATGPDLDNLAVFFGVTRKTIIPGDSTAFPPVVAVMEADTDLRTRIQLALEGFSTAGPIGAYLFWALTIDTIIDASVVGPPTVAPGNVVVTILSSLTANGIASADEITAVTKALNADTVRPLTDLVTVNSVAVTNYAIAATVYTLPGPDAQTVINQATANINAYVAAQRKVGKSIHLSAIYAALFVPGVSNVVLTAPVVGGVVSDVAIDYAHVGFCTGITLTPGGVQE